MTHEICSCTVSIVIPVYNCEQYLRSAVASVGTSSLVIEIFVVDDCSTDSSYAVASDIAKLDDRVRLLANSTNMGPSFSRNLAIGAATGDWIAILDADDEFTANRLEFLLGVAIDQGLDVVCDTLQPIDSHGTELKATPIFEFDTNIEWAPLSPESFISADNPGNSKTNAGYLKPIFRSDYLRKNNISYDERYRVGEDALLLFECLINGAKAAVTSRSLYRYRMTDNSLSRKKNSNNYEILYQVNQSMIDLADAHDATLRLKELLSLRSQMYQCAVNYEQMMRSFKQRRVFKGFAIYRDSKSCRKFFAKTFFRRLASRIRWT